MKNVFISLISVAILIGLLIPAISCQETTSVTPTPISTPTPTSVKTLADIRGLGTEIGSVQYDVITTDSSEPQRAGKVWLKGAWSPKLKIRCELTLEGLPTIVYLTDYGTGTHYYYFKGQNTTAFKINATGELAPKYPPEGWDKIYPTLVSTETIDGKACWVYEWTENDIEYKDWLWKEHPLAIREEVTTSSGNTTTELKNIQFGPISDDLFQLPSGMQVEDTSPFSSRMRLPLFVFNAL